MSELDWDHARVFLAVARAGQLLGAARRLGVDQATVTRRIDRLEALLGTQLLERTTTGTRLTPAGEVVLAHAERIEREFDELAAGLTEGSGEILGSVRIGAPDAFGTLFLAPRLVALIAAHPGLNVQLVPLPRSFSLSKREVDLAITVEPPSEGRLKARKLAGYTLSFYASRAYLSTAPPLAALADLVGHRRVGYVPDLLFAPSLDVDASLEIDREPQFQCASALGQIAAVESGMGVGLLHDYAVAGNPDLVRVLTEHVITRAYYLVTHAGLAETAASRTVYDFIVGETAKARSAFAVAPVALVP
ncbi:MAG: LysR family transcriptional regulator [Hyphomicrobiaceae bacterium]|nr:LysR family transcriptional regulator [Hyphomicrobiaceae bacterium]